MVEPRLEAVMLALPAAATGAATCILHAASLWEAAMAPPCTIPLPANGPQTQAGRILQALLVPVNRLGSGLRARVAPGTGA